MAAIDPKPKSSKPARRADAQRNYERLLSVARAAAAELGERIVLEDVAREAGVAIGTLYRHFPTRQDLLAATFLDETDELRALAISLADAEAPFQALEGWLRLQLEYSARARSLGAAVMSAKLIEGSEMHEAYTAMVDAGRELLRRAQLTGEAREGVELSDVLRLVWGIVLSSSHGGASQERIDGMFELVIAGVRAEPS